MENFLKYFLGLNCIIYKKFNYKTIDYILFYINLINYLISHSLLICSIYLLFVDYKIYNLMLLFYYILDFILIYFGNQIPFLKVISRNYNLFLDIKYRKSTQILMICGLILSIFISGIGVFLNIKYSFDISNNIFNKIFNNYCLFFILFYSSLSKCNISILFFTIMSNISKFLKSFIENKIRHNNNYYIDEISIEYLILKRNYNKTIFVFNDIIGNMIGFYTIPTFYYLSHIKKVNFDFTYYIGLIYYAFFCIFFQYYLLEINSNITYLKSICSKNKSINDYITRKKNIYLFENSSIQINNINQNELSFKNYLIDIENAQSIDWIIFDTIINQKWNQFDILGVEIDNSTLIMKIFSIFLVLIIGKQII